MRLLTRWQDLPLSGKGLIVIAVPAAATVIIACATLMIGHHFVLTEQAVNHTLLAGQQIERLHASEIEASAHVRAYFITSEDQFVDRARESLSAFDVARQKLSDLTVGNPTQVPRLAEIARLERSRVEHVIDATTRFRVGALRQDELRAALKGAEAERIEIEKLLKAMQAEEDALRETRLSQLENLRFALTTITIVCAILGVAGGVGISILFAAGITNRIGNLQKNIGRLATGGFLDPLPHGRDEIGVLSDGLAQTAVILRHRTAALENASHGIAELDPAGNYVGFNLAYRQLTGLPEGYVSRVGTTLHPDDRDRLEEGIARMRASGRAEIEVRIMHPGIRATYVGITLVPVSENRDGGFFIFLQDIDRRKEAEAALVQAMDAVVAGSVAKNDFLAKISHDIRTPLNAILGAADLLAASSLTSDQTEYVGMFQRNSHRLLALINDFLDFSKIEAGALRVQNAPYRIRETVEEALATFRELAQRKGVRLGAAINADVPDRVLGDPLRVHQVLVNLLSNAVKFTRPGRVDVRVCTIAGDNKLRFAVSDAGPGIRGEDRQRIFGSFEQSENQGVNPREGCGLGLTICRELVELMGGEIGVSSAEGSGSTFHFTLPLVPVPQDVALLEPPLRTTGASPEAGPEVGQEVPRVLVVEDTEDNRLLLTYYLRGEQVEVHFAEDGQQAVDAVRGGESFDLVLMDLDMPVLDGLGAVKAIRSWEVEHGDAPIPIVGLSANAMHDAVRECLDAGCAAHVAKPVDKTTLLDTIRRYRRMRVPPNPVSSRIAALVPKYLSSKLGQIEEAAVQLEARDFEPIRRFGHNLKGTGVGYGFPRISAIGAEIEKSASIRQNQCVARQLEALRVFLLEDAGLVPKEAQMRESSEFHEQPRSGRLAPMQR